MKERKSQADKNCNNIKLFSFYFFIINVFILYFIPHSFFWSHSLAHVPEVCERFFVVSFALFDSKTSEKEENVKCKPEVVIGVRCHYKSLYVSTFFLLIFLFLFPCANHDVVPLNISCITISMYIAMYRLLFLLLECTSNNFIISHNI